MVALKACCHCLVYTSAHHVRDITAVTDAWSSSLESHRGSDEWSLLKHCGGRGSSTFTDLCWHLYVGVWSDELFRSSASKPVITSPVPSRPLHFTRFFLSLCFSLICHLPYLLPVTFPFSLDRTLSLFSAFSWRRCVTHLNSAAWHCVCDLCQCASVEGSSENVEWSFIHLRILSVRKDKWIQGGFKR